MFPFQLLFKTLARQLPIGSSKQGQATVCDGGEANLGDAATSLQETMSLLSKKLCEFAKKQDTQGVSSFSFATSFELKLLNVQEALVFVTCSE